jgi:hypothetical protein
VMNYVSYKQVPKVTKKDISFLNLKNCFVSCNVPSLSLTSHVNDRQLFELEQQSMVTSPDQIAVGSDRRGKQGDRTVDEPCSTVLKPSWKTVEI